MLGDWRPADEDAPPAGLGWIYTNKTYDEFGRPRLLTKPDNSTVEHKYDGCGCSGNTSTTVTDELGQQTRTRTDFLGRLAEVSELPFDPVNNGIYNKAVYSYDVLDRLTRIEHYDGGWSPSKKQTRSFVYDGYAVAERDNT